MTTPAMTGKDRAMPNNSDQAAMHDELRADLAAARRERDEAREAQEYAELQLAYLANEMVFNGNSIGWIASKADNYKAALGRAWSALTESGGKCDGNTELAEAIRQHFAALSMPASEAVAWQFQDRDGVWFNFNDVKHREDTIASGEWPIRALYSTPQPSPAAHAGGEAVCVGYVYSDVSEGRRYKMATLQGAFAQTLPNGTPLYTHPSPMPVDALRELADEFERRAARVGTGNEYNAGRSQAYDACAEELTALIEKETK